MTAKRERSSELVRATVVLAALGLAACSTVGSPVAGGNPTDGDTGDGDGDGDGNNPTDGNPAPEDGDDGDGEVDEVDACGTAALAAKDMIQTYCADCHGATPVNNNFKDILDAKALVDSGRIIPDDPDNSPLFKRISTNSMPPASYDKRPGQADVDALRDWIACGAENWDGEGAPLPFISINERLELMREDLRSVNEADRPDVRYFELHNLSNAGFSKSQIEEYASAMSFVMNSLSTGLRVVPPKQVDDLGLLYRIELGDYGWDAEKWDLLTEAYPYMVQYDEDGNLFSFNETDNEDIRDETEEEIPYINVDWFISHAAIPPLYHQLLGIPGNGEPLEVLEEQLGINILENIDNGEEVRSGFLKSQPSDANRIIARHELPGNQGAFWISYDFVNNIAAQGRDIKVNPINPDCDGGEAIFTLPNGLQAYYVVAGCPLVANAARELNIAPIGVVQDPAAFDGQVTTGLSCLTCHATVGIIPKSDDIYEHVRKNGLPGLNGETFRSGNDELNAVEKAFELYPGNDVLQEIFDEDANSYRSALAAAGADKVDESSIHSIHQKHLDEIDVNQVAAIVGISTQELIDAIESSQAPDSFDTLTDVGGQIDRDALDADFQGLIEAIGIGAPIVPQNSN